MTNLTNLFNINIRIKNESALAADSVWPMNIEICICRIPIRKRDGFNLEELTAFAKKLKQHMSLNGIVFLICYAPIEDRGRPFEVARAMTDQGFNHIDNIIMEKTWFPGKHSEVNLVSSHEYVFHFCNGTVWNLDRSPIRQYLNTPEETTCPGNVWKIKTGSLMESYPVDLAELLIRMTDRLPGSIVFDPFCGTTSSLRAAVKVGHSFYGFESDIDKFNKIKEVVNTYVEEGVI